MGFLASRFRSRRSRHWGWLGVPACLLLASCAAAPLLPAMIKTGADLLSAAAANFQSPYVNTLAQFMQTISASYSGSAALATSIAPPAVPEAPQPVQEVAASAPVPYEAPPAPSPPAVAAQAPRWSWKSASTSR
ncbi:MAG: hypothetical protein KatS3mg131_0937 [Candidatus Tectimicrobiota bacterium]|nr:MAG: hypothetical protein KatS3mg131_0937 [Candidatus Tectomicrobia bacterium]